MSEHYAETVTLKLVLFTLPYTIERKIQREGDGMKTMCTKCTTFLNTDPKNKQKK